MGNVKSEVVGNEVEGLANSAVVVANSAAGGVIESYFNALLVPGGLS